MTPGSVAILLAETSGLRVQTTSPTFDRGLVRPRLFFDHQYGQTLFVTGSVNDGAGRCPALLRQMDSRSRST